MFDLITGELKHAPRHQTAPIVVSVVAHAVVASAVLMATVFFVGEQLPEVKTMMAFVAAPPAPQPPPAPAPPAPARAQREQTKPVPAASPAAPVEAPIEIASETPAPDVDEEGTMAGVEGGVPGGVAGGVVAALDAEVPPPPPPAPAPRAPIRVGGAVKEPALVHRVDPVYPVLAVSAGLEGTVILEAIVDRDGRVESLRVLRSQGVLDRAALDAVKQWRYSPVLLNGQPEKFILTVVVSFKLEDT
jgi:protein TonB